MPFHTTSRTARRALPGLARRAFSLIEILVVVIVIGILAAIVVPNSINANDTARIAATAEDLRAIGMAVESYRSTEGRWPRDVNRAVMPTELEGAFKSGNPFDKNVPIGGVYDYDGATSSRGPRISIRGGTGNPLPSNDIIQQLDDYMDDGDLTTGRIRHQGGAIMYLIMGN